MKFLYFLAIFLAPETGQTAGQFQTRTAEGVGVWPQWQGQQSHHRSSSNEQHVQQPSAQQPGQPEVFQVKGSKDFRKPETGRERVRGERQRRKHAWIEVSKWEKRRVGHMKIDVIN